MKEDIEIRSEEVQDILTETPKWIVRRGIMVIFIITLLCVVGSYFFIRKSSGSYNRES